MKLVIKNKNDYDERFIKNYLKKLMIKLIKDNYNLSRALQFNQELNLNVLNIFIYAVKTINISESGDSWIISIDKTKIYGNYNLSKLIFYITYGTRTIKGYKLLYNIFEYIANNLELIYREWLNGY